MHPHYHSACLVSVNLSATTVNSRPVPPSPLSLYLRSQFRVPTARARKYRFQGSKLSPSTINFPAIPTIKSQNRIRLGSQYTLHAPVATGENTLTPTGWRTCMRW
jgi:hypothetical protein